jgi:hypothetical protein
MFETERMTGVLYASTLKVLKNPYKRPTFEGHSPVSPSGANRDYCNNVAV